MPRGAEGALQTLHDSLGERLVGATWHQSIAEFPALSVGVTYLPIPIGGAITLLFVTERVVIGPPTQPSQPHGAAAND